MTTQKFEFAAYCVKEGRLRGISACTTGFVAKSWFKFVRLINDAGHYSVVLEGEGLQQIND